MAIRYNDELSQALGDSEYSERHDIWLWYTLVFFENNFNPETFPNYGMRDKMARYLQANKWKVDPLLQKRREQLIPKKNLEWITNERRLVEWLTKEIQKLNQPQSI